MEEIKNIEKEKTADEERGKEKGEEKKREQGKNLMIFGVALLPVYCGLV